MDVALDLSILLILFLLNGFFAMAEMSIVSSRRIRLQQMAEQHRRGAVQALALADNPGSFLSAIQVGITLISILSGAFGGATLGARLGPVLDGVPGLAPYGDTVAVGLVVVGITAVSTIIGELVPKRMALSCPELIAVRVARPLQIVSAIARPFAWILERSSAVLLRLMGIPERRRSGITEEEVRFAIAEGTESGAIDAVEEDMIHGVLALADRSVASIMTPRPDVYWIDLDDNPDALAREVTDCPFSRIVVARGGDLGHPLGVVQKKDLIPDLLAGRGLNLEGELREPMYVPENAQVLRMLEMFRSTPLHIAFVVDEYGDFLGLVTLTDVLEAIAGEIPEEHAPKSEDIVRRPDGAWLVAGRVAVEELADKLGLEKPDGDFHTAAGLALDRLERIPSKGDTFAVEEWTVEVVAMDGKRIERLLFTPAKKAQAAE